MAPRAERAKIFAPFDALKGFHEALAEQEMIIVPKVELTDDKKDELDYKLKHMDGHPVVTVIYYSFADNNYLQITGKVARISVSSRILQIVNTRISFDDIRDIQGECFDEILAE